MPGVKIGDPIDLCLRLWDRAETKYVRARLYDEDEVELGSSPVSLAHLDEGTYFDDSVAYPNTRRIIVNYDVFNDASFTSKSKRHLPQVDIFELDDVSQTVEQILSEIVMADLTARIKEDEPLSAVLIEDSEMINFIDSVQRIIIPAVNGSGSAQVALKVWAWKGDSTSENRVDLADANTVTLSDFAGVNVDPVVDGQTMQLTRVGLVPGILVGLGAKPGQLVYLGETPGTVSLVAPDPFVDSNSVILLGQAMPSSELSTEAENLFLNADIIDLG